MSEDKLRDAHMALKRKDKAIAQLKLKEQRLDDLRERVIAVRELHKANGAGMCAECMPDGAIRMPCATIKALDGFPDEA